MEWTAENVAQRLSGTGRSKSKRMGAGQWKACCPAHEDRTPSLHLTDGRNGLLWRCFGGCSQEAVQEAIRDAMGGGSATFTKAPSRKTKIVDTFEAHVPTEAEYGPIGLDDFYHFDFGAPAKVWMYRDTGRQPLFFVAPCALPRGTQSLYARAYPPLHLHRAAFRPSFG